MCTLNHEPVRLFSMIYKADVMVHNTDVPNAIANIMIIYKQNYKDKDRT